jgi:hypothetical protein
VSRLNLGRYDPPVTPEEHSALRSELWVLVFLVAVMLLATFAESIMDWLEAML